MPIIPSQKNQIRGTKDVWLVGVIDWLAFVTANIMHLRTGLKQNAAWQFKGNSFQICGAPTYHDHKSRQLSLTTKNFRTKKW